MQPPSGDLSERSSRIRAPPVFVRKATILLTVTITTVFFANVCEAAPKVMSRRPGTPPRLLALFVLIRPNLSDRLAVVAPGFGGDFLHDDKKRQDRSPQNLPQYDRRFLDRPRSVFHRTSGDRADYRLDTDKTRAF